MEESIIYICIHQRLSNNVDSTRLMDKKNLYLILKKIYHIPKNMIPPIIKEMESKGILQNLNKRHVIINPIYIDLDKEMNKIYEEMGVF